MGGSGVTATLDGVTVWIVGLSVCHSFAAT